MAPIIIDNEASLQSLLLHISSRVKAEANQLLFMDLEGINLSRSGTVAIMQLLIPPSPVVYLIDVHVLGAKAFETEVDESLSLKRILESRTIFKVLFDVRNDSDALYSHFGVELVGVIDLQILEYATRQPRGKFVHGLARCIERDLPASQDWSLTKARGRHLFAPEIGGRYEVFIERPLAEDIVKYCEQDVLLMPKLLAVYGRKLLSGVAAQLQDIVDYRLHLSRNYANRRLSPEMELVCMDRIGLLCHVDDNVEDLSSQFKLIEIKKEHPAVSDDGPSETTDTPDASGYETPITNMSMAVSSAPESITLTGTPPDINPIEAREDYDEDERDEIYQDRGYVGSYSDTGSVLDYAACSSDSCGYCGRCDY